MQKSDFFEKAVKILEKGYVCDHCLGRQFAQLLSGMENRERGRIIRDFLAMFLDSGDSKTYTEMVDPANFSAYKFRFRDLTGPGEIPDCSICAGLFDNLDFYLKKAVKNIKGLEFSNFLVGTKIDRKLLRNEENLWERVGIEWCEPIKAEINRLVGKALEKKLRKTVEFNNPEVLVLVNLRKRDIDLEINSLYIYGEYNKHGKIPQTRWPSGKYKTSVEQIAAKPVLGMTKGKGSKFHGAGREDIDARCLAWRPFVLEILEPRKRKVRLRRILAEINRSKKIQVKNLKIVNSNLVEKIKEIRPEKTYRVIVKTKDELGDLKRLSLLNGKRIYQETPTRVMHRRADRLRKREIKDIKWKKLAKKKLELTIRTEAGTYVKEFVSGDKGRTYPSISETLGTRAQVEKLDVLKIHRKKA
ncbi:MAG: tRNA pseudouridine(54/55) synthase Pus10 [archaeon]|nr:MAG: tRNA pseudouridine(54/55) synthase Pus10 [archaeon]